MRAMLVMLHHREDRIPALSVSCLKAYAMGQPDLCGRVSISVHNLFVDDDPLFVLSLVEARRPDLVGLSCYEWNLSRSLDLSRQIKALHPETAIVLGGPQVFSGAPAILDRHLAVDFIVCGEGEIAFAELLRHLLSAGGGDPPAGVTYRRNGAAHHGGEAPLLQDLDDLPCVYEPELMPLVGNVVYCETSRGCPHRCAFCHWGRGARGRRVRTFSLQRILGDLEVLKKRGVSKIYFCDASFILKKDRAKEILRRINADDGLTGIAMDVDAAHLDAELVGLLRPKTVELLVGVQSIHAEALANCRRPWHRASFEPMVRLLGEAEIPLAFQVIYGLPGDSHQLFLETLQYLVSLWPAKIQPFQLQILPGTHFAERAEALGLRHDPHPPHLVLATATYSLADLVRSRKVASLVHKLGCGFSWSCIPGILQQLEISFTTFIEGLVSFVKEHHLLDTEELYSEVHLLQPARELAILEQYLAHLYQTSDAADLLVYPRLHALLRYRYLLHLAGRATPSGEPPGRAVAGIELEQARLRLADGIHIEGFPYDVVAMGKEGMTRGTRSPLPTTVVFFKDGARPAAMKLSEQEARFIRSFDGSRSVAQVVSEIAERAESPGAERSRWLERLGVYLGLGFFLSV